MYFSWKKDNRLYSVTLTNLQWGKLQSVIKKKGKENNQNAKIAAIRIAGL
jgi:hypothetical protein